MPWAAGVYTKGNDGTGGWTGDAGNGIGIEAGRHDTQDNDFTTGINSTLNKDGSNVPSGNLPMGGFRHTGVGLATARDSYATLGQAQDGTAIWGGTSGGTANAQTLTLSPAITAYAAGQRFGYFAVATNTGALTININGLGAKAVQWRNLALTGNEIEINAAVEIVYDGTAFQSVQLAGNATSRAQAPTLAQVQDSTALWGGTSGGSANAQTLTLTPAITAYVAGQSFRFIAGLASTGALTLQINGIASPVTCLSAETKLAMGTYSNLIAGLAYNALYNGTNFLINTFSEFVGYTNDTAGATVNLAKSRSATAGTSTIVQNGDLLGTVSFNGANGTGFTRGAAITASIDGTPGASNDMPTVMTFTTCPDGSGTALERMRISPSGRIGIGTSSTVAFATISNLESSSINTLTVSSGVAGDVGTHALVIVKKDNNTTTSQLLVAFLSNAGATGQGQINGNGANAAAFGSYSDARLKENIIDLPSQLEAICNLRPVEFDYKDGAGHQLGFIAQEVQEIYPDLVGEGDNGFLTLSDLNKNDARMIKAFQELCCKVEALEARLAVLEAV